MAMATTNNGKEFRAQSTHTDTYSVHTYRLSDVGVGTKLTQSNAARTVSMCRAPLKSHIYFVFRLSFFYLFFFFSSIQFKFGFLCYPLLLYIRSARCVCVCFARAIHAATAAERFLSESWKFLLSVFMFCVACRFSHFFSLLSHSLVSTVEIPFNSFSILLSSRLPSRSLTYSHSRHCLPSPLLLLLLAVIREKSL